MRRDRLESFTACRVPNLQIHQLVIIRLDYLARKFDTNRWLRLTALPRHIPLQNARLSRVRIPRQHNLEQHVILLL